MFKALPISNYFKWLSPKVAAMILQYRKVLLPDFIVAKPYSHRMNE